MKSEYDFIQHIMQKNILPLYFRHPLENTNAADHHLPPPLWPILPCA